MLPSQMLSFSDRHSFCVSPVSTPISVLCPRLLIGFVVFCMFVGGTVFVGDFFFFYFYFFGLYFRLLYLNFLKGLLCKTSILPVCLRHPMAIIVGCLSCLLFACLLFIAFLLRLVFFPLLEHFFFNILLV